MSHESDVVVSGGFGAVVGTAVLPLHKILQQDGFGILLPFY